MFNKSNRLKDSFKKRKNHEEERNKKFQKSLRNKLNANARDIKLLEKEHQMKKVVKHRPRRNPKFLGFCRINYDNM